MKDNILISKKMKDNAERTSGITFFDINYRKDYPIVVHYHEKSIRVTIFPTATDMRSKDDAHCPKEQ